jgi:NADH:ubiquinone oxidoreductase subunit K
LVLTRQYAAGVVLFLIGISVIVIGRVAISIILIGISVMTVGAVLAILGHSKGRTRSLS